MLMFLSNVKLEFNELDVWVGACMEFLTQCNAGKARDLNPACQVEVKHRTDDHPPQIKVTFITGVEEAFDTSTTSAQFIRSLILEKGKYHETEQLFRDAGEAWPVIIPEDELHQPAPSIK